MFCINVTYDSSLGNRNMAAHPGRPIRAVRPQRCTKLLYNKHVRSISLTSHPISKLILAFNSPSRLTSIRCQCYSTVTDLATVGASNCITQSISGMSMPRPMMSVHTKTPLLHNTCPIKSLALIIYIISTFFVSVLLHTTN